ncbi:MAG: hypothetical protein ABIG44_16650 [Planctomycetota bacterium]
MSRRVLLRLTILLLAISTTLRVWAQCPLDWTDGFGASGLTGDVNSMAVFDDGSGSALYVGGWLHVADDCQIAHFLKWDGQSWSLPEDRPNDISYALGVYDLGTGPALYAGGVFYQAGGTLARSVACWDGDSWYALGGGVTGNVYALAAFDDGTGPALFAGGSFREAGGVAARSIARWDGQEWSALEGDLWHMDLYPEVYALAVYDDGNGPALYVAGKFMRAGGVDAYNIAKWDGVSWSDVGGGLGGVGYPYVNALTVYDDGTGPALYAGGHFEVAGQVYANHIARWDGQSWAPLGDGINSVGTGVTALAVCQPDEAERPMLYVGGMFFSAGDIEANHVACWDGTQWSALGSGVQAGNFTNVTTLAAFDPPGSDGPGVYVGGDFAIADGVLAPCIARWDGAAFSPLGSGGNGTDESVYTLEVFDDGHEPALYAGGRFWGAGGLVLNHIGRWDGAGWSDVGGGTNGKVYTLTVFDDDAGPALYVGGSFLYAGGIPAYKIAKWDGTVWSALDGGLPGYGWVRAIKPFEDGTGLALYVGGDFSEAGGQPVRGIVKWDGVMWSSVGSGVEGTVYAMTSHDDGSGPALYVGGVFSQAGDVTAYNIARWDGLNWSAVGYGLPDGVGSLASLDDGSGPALYANANSPYVIYKWDGSTWSLVGDGLEGATGGLTIFDDGSGPALYAGGGPTGLAKWNGRRWQYMGGGVGGGIGCMTAYDDGAGSSLYVGGYFTSTGGLPAANFGRWGCVPGLWLGDLNCDGAVDVYDIDPFICAVSPNCDYAAEFPDCNPITGDCNADGIVNAYDIDGFIALIGGG